MKFIPFWVDGSTATGYARSDSQTGCDRGEDEMKFGIEVMRSGKWERLKMQFGSRKAAAHYASTLQVSWFRIVVS